jgi:beta-lactamase family protein
LSAVTRARASLALAVLVAAGSAIGPAAALGRSERARARALAADEPYPGLRSVGELSQPGGQSKVDGEGVYPALRPPERLVFPGPAAIQAARAFAARRKGRVAFAVADTRGAVVGSAENRPYRSASLIKAMLMVAYLRRLNGEGQGISPADNFRLDAMIRVSDNDSASSIYKRLGRDAVLDLARRTGMRRFDVGAIWGNARVTAADQARFFLVLDRLLPARFRAYARNLLQNVQPLQTWGVPDAARPRWRVLFKGGWRPDGGAQIVHQGALLEHGPRRLAIVVLSDGDPSERYGHQTIRGVAAHLLSRRPPARHVRKGQLVPLPSLRGYRPPRLRSGVHPVALRQKAVSGK